MAETVWVNKAVLLACTQEIEALDALGFEALADPGEYSSGAGNTALKTNVTAAQATGSDYNDLLANVAAFLKDARDTFVSADGNTQ